jgi:hypothetical protein
MKRQTFPRKFADEPEQIIPLALRPPALTVKKPPARGWLAKVAVASVCYLLCWSGVHSTWGSD